MWIGPLSLEARTQKGRTAAELENPYDWEKGPEDVSAAEKRQYQAQVTPQVESTSWKRTPQDVQKDQFYQRYFRKGKEVKKEEDLPTSPEERQILLKKLIPQHTPTPADTPQEQEIKKLIHDLGTEPHRRQAAVERLAMIGVPAVPALRLALRHSYKFKRIGALQALGYIQSQAALPDIQKLLRDPESAVRAEAVKVLGRMKHRSSAALITQCLQDSDKRVRREAVMALGRIKGKCAQNGLIKALHNKYAEIREIACDELSFFTGTEVIAALLTTIHDTDRDTRLAAIRALGEIGDPAVRPQLQKLTRSEDRMIRQEALQALSNLQ